MIPLNAVAGVGEDAIFNCSTNRGPDWIFSKDGTSAGELNITTGCSVNPVLRNQYRTEEQGPNFTCSLLAFNVTMEQAGVYRCTDIYADIAYYALLTVMGKLQFN